MEALYEAVRTVCVEEARKVHEQLSSEIASSAMSLKAEFGTKTSEMEATLLLVKSRLDQDQQSGSSLEQLSEKFDSHISLLKTEMASLEEKVEQKMSGLLDSVHHVQRGISDAGSLESKVDAMQEQFLSLQRDLELKASQEQVESMQEELSQNVTESDFDTKLESAVTTIAEHLEEMHRSLLEKASAKDLLDVSASINEDLSVIRTSVSQKLDEDQVRSLLQRSQQDGSDPDLSGYQDEAGLRSLLEDKVSHHELEAAIPKVLEISEQHVRAAVAHLQERITDIHLSMSQLFSSLEGIQTAVNRSPSKEKGEMARIG